MPTVATGQLSGPLAALRTLIAGSATFQAAVGAVDTSSALPRVYGINNEEPVRPFAIIYETSKVGFTQVMGAFGPAELECKIEYPIANGIDELEAFTQFGNAVDAIMGEVFDAANGDGTLCVTDVSLDQVPMRSDPLGEGDQFYFASFKVKCGLEGG